MDLKRDYLKSQLLVLEKIVILGKDFILGKHIVRLYHLSVKWTSHRCIHLNIRLKI